MFNVKTDCTKCGKKNVDNLDNSLIIEGHGGYEQFIDTAFNEEPRFFYLCHMCAHKFMLFLGPNGENFTTSFNSGSHLRPDVAGEKDENLVSWWHYGWDNLRIRGLLSLIVYEVRLHKSLKGIKIAINKVQNGRQEWTDQGEERKWRW